MIFVLWRMNAGILLLQNVLMLSSCSMCHASSLNFLADCTTARFFAYNYSRFTQQRMLLIPEAPVDGNDRPDRTSDFLI